MHSDKAFRQSLKFGAIILRALPEMPDYVVQRWTKDPRGLRRILGHALNPPIGGGRFPTFMTIKLGVYGDEGINKLITLLKKRGNKMTDHVERTFPLIPLVSEEVLLELVLVSVGDLDLPGCSSTSEIYTRAKELGLDLCPAQAGLELRLSYRDQPQHETITMAMEPVLSNGTPIIFNIEHDFLEKGRRISNTLPIFNWPAFHKFVFTRHKEL